MPADSLAEHHYATPEAANLTLVDVEAFAESIAEALGFKPGGKIEPIVRRLGGTFEYLTWGDWLAHDDDTITVDGPRKFTIRLRGSDGPLQHRFTIARDLGHYFLHSKAGRRRIKAGRNLENTRVEWEANWFAAGFLMPAAAFSKAMIELGSDPHKLASRFLVSIQAATVRIEALCRQNSCASF